MTKITVRYQIPIKYEQSKHDIEVQRFFSALYNGISL